MFKNISFTFINIMYPEVIPVFKYNIDKVITIKSINPYNLEKFTRLSVYNYLCY